MSAFLRRSRLTIGRQLKNLRQQSDLFKGLGEWVLAGVVAVTVGRYVNILAQNHH